MEAGSSYTYLIGKDLNSSSDLPFLALDINGNVCTPTRQVFQILHKHEAVEFILVKENKLRIQTTMSEVIVNEGEGVFIPKNVLHILDTYGDCVCFAFLFDDSLLAPMGYRGLYNKIKEYTENPLLDVTKIIEGNVLDQLQLLSDISYDNLDDEYGPFKLMSVLNNLWYTFMSQSTLGTITEGTPQKVQGERLKTYLEYIQINYAKSITVKDIAASCFTSPSECNRIFKSVLNITAYEYLIQYRISKSLELLKSGEYTVAQVAFEVGYNSPSQFAKYFKRQMDMTPREYLKLC